jgi:hypothetical protein
MSDDRPPVYYEGEELIIRASGIGSSCMWELIAAGQGYPQSEVPAFLQEKFDEGIRWEPVVIEKMKKHGWVFESHQNEGHLIFVNGGVIKVRYHSDGIARAPDGERYVVEIKAFSVQNYSKAVLMGVGSVVHEYPWQLSVMMHGEDLPGAWVAVNKVTEELHYQLMPQPPIGLSYLRDKAFKIKQEVEGEDIVASGKVCDNPNHWPCRYLHLRPEAEGVVVPRTGGIDQYEVDQLVREYLMFKGQADEAYERRDAAKQKLIDIAGDRTELRTDKWVVPVVEGRTSSIEWTSVPPELRAQIERYRTKVTRYRYLRNIKRLD